MIRSLVSIIMPAYNSAKYVAQSVRSVQSQTYTAWELIIIDDCSCDNTADIVTQLEAGDSRIRVYRNEHNVGVAESRNKGIELAQGEWIAFLDSDDCWTPYKLEHQVFFAYSHEDANFIFTASAFIDENGRRFKWVMNVPERVSYEQLLKHNLISCSSVMLNKNFIKNHKMYNDSIHEDFALWLEILNDGIVAYGINEPLLVYRISSQSKSGNKVKSAMMTFLTYRVSGLNLIYTFYNMLFYLVHGFIKYRNIYKLGYEESD